MPEVLYYVCRAGEEPTPRELAHPNAFSCQHSNNRTRLVFGDVLRDFPLRAVGNPLSFAFQTSIAGTIRWLHMNRDALSDAVPLSTSRGNRIFMKVVIPAGCTGLFLNAQKTYAAASASPTSDATLGMASFANSDNHTNNMAQHGRCSAGDEARFNHRKSHKTETTRQESSLSPGHTSREQHASGYSRRRRRKSHKDNTTTTTTTTTSKSSGLRPIRRGYDMRPHHL